MSDASLPPSAEGGRCGSLSDSHFARRTGALVVQPDNFAAATVYERIGVGSSVYLMHDTEGKLGYLFCTDLSDHDCQMTTVDPFELLKRGCEALLKEPCVAVLGWGSAVQGGYDAALSDVDLVLVVEDPENVSIPELTASVRGLGGRYDIHVLRRADLALTTPPAIRLATPPEMRVLHPAEVFLIRNHSLLLSGEDVRPEMPDLLPFVAIGRSLGSFVRRLQDSFSTERWRDDVSRFTMTATLSMGVRKIAFLRSGRAYTKPDSLKMLAEAPIDPERDGELVRFIGELLSDGTWEREAASRYERGVETILRDCLVALTGKPPEGPGDIPALAEQLLRPLRERLAQHGHAP